MKKLSVTALVSILVSLMFGCNRGAEQEPAETEPKIYVLKQVKFKKPPPPAGTFLPTTGGTHEPNDQPVGDMFFDESGVNPFIDTEDDRLSTFALEVDTASYTIARRYLRDGYLPPSEAIRVEEMLNSFDYGDPEPAEGDFALTFEGAPSPFGENDKYWIARIGLKARAVSRAQRPPLQMVIAVDTSGSMEQNNRLELVKRSLELLLDGLRDDDRIGLVGYGDEARVIAEPSVDRAALRKAIWSLQPKGSTYAEAGIVEAFRLIQKDRRDGEINRVLLCSDGVANVGRTGPESILERIRGLATSGIELSTVGFGMGNYNDVLMEGLADAGDGRYAYVDTIREARRIFVDGLEGTLVTVAHEAKAQIEFEPELVSRYRLLGYENRDIADEDFRDPEVDAGEIGAGHAVTVVYELKLNHPPSAGERLATVRLRYRSVDGAEVGEPVESTHAFEGRHMSRDWATAPRGLRQATVVAEYSEVLNESYWARQSDLDRLLDLGRSLAAEEGSNPQLTELADLMMTMKGLKERKGG